MTSIQLTALAKEYGTMRVLDDVTLTVVPGRVTGFLGPNGAGKSTTMRLVLGLDRPTSGTALLDGARYVDLDRPLRHVGALLDGAGPHPGRTVEGHLRFLAESNALPARRPGEVLAEVGLEGVARHRVRTLSLGMRQRLGLAAALLGDPPVLLLDEPTNGLDPEGIVWIRELLRRLADEGRTLLVSSHLMTEIARIADHLVVLGRGRLLVDQPLRTFLDDHTAPGVEVAADDGPRLREVLQQAGHTPRPVGKGRLRVEGVRASEVGRLAARAGVVVSQLAESRTSLEEAYLRLTADAADHTAGRDAPRTAEHPAGGAARRSHATERADVPGTPKTDTEGSGR